jgi:hypothetical protein
MQRNIGQKDYGNPCARNAASPAGGTAMTAPRMRLKHAAGWFAAGREVAEAMNLLSDAASKVFYWVSP